MGINEINAENERINALITERLAAHRREIMKGQMPPFEIHGDSLGANNLFTVNIGNVSLHFSYRTLIGIHVHDRNDVTGMLLPTKSYRQENVWGPTTGKHVRKHGLEHAEIRTEAELCEIVRGALFEDVVRAPLNQGEQL